MNPHGITPASTSSQFQDLSRGSLCFLATSSRYPLYRRTAPCFELTVPKPYQSRKVGRLAQKSNSDRGAAERRVWATHSGEEVVAEYKRSDCARTNADDNDREFTAAQTPMSRIVGRVIHRDSRSCFKVEAARAGIIRLHANRHLARLNTLSPSWAASDASSRFVRSETDPVRPRPQNYEGPTNCEPCSRTSFTTAGKQPSCRGRESD